MDFLPDEERALFERLLHGLADLPAAERESALPLLAHPLSAEERVRFFRQASEDCLVDAGRCAELLKAMPAADPPKAGEGDDGLPEPVPSAGGSGAEPTVADSSPSRGLDALPRTAGLAFDRYHLLRCIGSGGMGTVWQAWDVRLCRVVALKVVKARAAGDPVYLARFRREAQAMARLRHPHLARVHDVGESAGRAYLTMDYLVGRTLEDRWHVDREMRGGGGLLDADRLRCDMGLLADVADGVASAHRAGVVHRDLKPGNVMLIDAGDGGLRAVVMDFGLAHGVVSAAAGDGRLTVRGLAIGTPSYMAPEQAAGERERIGPPCDVWALGAMLYERLTGRPPFVGDSPVEIMTALVTESVRPPRERDPQVPAGLEAIALRALAKEPDGRYASAAELADDLRRWLRGEPVRTGAAGAGRRALLFFAHHRLFVLMVGLTLAVAALAFGAVSWERMRESARRLALLAQIGSSVRSFEDSVMRTEVPPAARAALAEQPLGLLEQLIADDPECGQAYAWRARVGELLGRPGIEVDYDTACVKAGADPVPWLLRGLHRLEGYRASRGLPSATVSAAGYRFVEPPPETPTQIALREGGLADLGRAQGGGDPEELACAHALAELYSGADLDGVVMGLAGMRGRRALALRGLAFYHRGRFADAEAEFGALLESWPEDVEARHHRALTRQALGLTVETRGKDPRDDLRRAIADFDEVVRRAPGWLEPRGNRGGAYLYLGNAEGARGEDAARWFGLAIDDFTAALRTAPRAVWLRGNRAVALRRAGMNEEAHGRDPRGFYRQSAEDLAEAVSVRPDDPGIRSNRAQSLLCLARAHLARGEEADGYLDEAEAEADEAVRRAPDSAQVLHDRVVVLETRVLFARARGADAESICERALRDLERALAQAPDFADLYALRGVMLKVRAELTEERGEDPRELLRRAVADQDEALRRLPLHTAAHNNRGAALQGLGNAEMRRGGDPGPHFDRADADYGTMLERNPADVRAWHNRASLRHNRGLLEQARQGDGRERFRAAIADYGEALRRAPDFRESRVGRGISGLELGRAESLAGGDARAVLREAVQDLDVALQAYDDAETRAYRALALLALGPLEAALGQDPRPLFRQAISDLDAAVQEARRPETALQQRAQVWLALAEAQQRAGESPEEAWAHAEADLRAAVRRGAAGAWLSLAQLYEGLGRYGEAAAACGEYAAAVPAQAMGLEARVAGLRARAELAAEAWAQEMAAGDALVRAQDYPAARARYEAGLRLREERWADSTAAERAADDARPVVRAVLANARYNLACVEALAAAGRDRPGAPAREIDPGQRAARLEAALGHLEAALRAGFDGREHARRDPDLEALRGDPRFEALLGR